MSSQATVTPEPAAAVPFECDLILKGGITSGVVYPTAIAEIARDHRIRSIAGSSAGAIAAVSAAAAELGRRSTTGGFDALGGMPSKLAELDASGRTLLQRLFQGDERTRSAFDLLWALRSEKRAKQRVKIALNSAFRGAGSRWVIGALVGIICGIVLAGFAAAFVGVWASAAAALLALLVLVVLLIAWLVAGVRAMAASTLAGIDANGFGLCNGLTPNGASSPAITDWLHEQIQVLAGRGDEGVDEAERARPVTYGELAAAGIELRTTTTDLSRGTSELFPFSERTWAFKPEDLRSVLPAAVVDHLVDRSPPSKIARRTDGTTLNGTASARCPQRQTCPCCWGPA